MQDEILRIDGKAIVVIDGDSFKSASEEYRVHGIDAPEYRQTCKDRNGNDWPCGRSARSQLEKVLARGVWSCSVKARDQFGRAIVTCQDADNQDLGASLVRSGHAVSGDHFDMATYGSEETQARNAKRGIWQGDFESPDVWRSENPRGS